MTTQKSFKRRVRERMDKTGESYAAARRQLVPDREATSSVPADDAPSGAGAGDAVLGGNGGNQGTDLLIVAEERVADATGHGYDHWFALLDAWGATSRTHTEIARYLTGELDVDGWWAQTVTVSYERVRGMRVPGQRAGGFEASASRTVDAPAERLFAAFEDETLRELWLPGAPLRRRTATAPRSARYDWGDGGSRVVVGIVAKDAGGTPKSTVTVTHERLSGRDDVEGRKVYWRSRLSELKGLLED